VEKDKAMATTRPADQNSTKSTRRAVLAGSAAALTPAIAAFAGQQHATIGADDTELLKLGEQLDLLIDEWLAMSVADDWTAEVTPQ
jgi:hypothetical protein